VAWTGLVEWVVAGNAPAEPDWLEYKSAVSAKSDWAAIARYILGAANRLPEQAETHLGGAAILLLGIDDHGTLVGATPLDPAVVEQSLGQFLGHDGPQWEIRNLPIGPGRVNVVAFEVQPPEEGRIFVCHRTSDGIRSGAVYVRRPGQTEEANYDELCERLDRASRGARPRVDLEVTLVGCAYHLDPGLDERNEQYINSEVAAFLRKHSPAPSTYGPLAMSLPKLVHQQNPEDYIAGWRRDRQEDWPERRSLLVGALADAVNVTIVNKAKSPPLERPQIVLVLQHAQGVDWEDGLEVERDEVFPHPSEAFFADLGINKSALRHIRPLNARRSLEWRNVDRDTLECVVTPESIRPGLGWTCEPDELVVIATDSSVDEVQVTWRATFHGIDQEYKGTATLPVVPLVIGNST